MDTIPKELVSLIQSASKPAAPAAQTAQAPSASPKASTDLLQGLVDAKKGKPDETLKSKLTDTDTLIRFAAGLGAILSGEAGMGAALVGAGFANAGQEAADDNKKRDQEVDALTLKMADNAFQREGQMISAGVANPELIAGMPDYINKVGNIELGTSLFNSAVALRDRRLGKERAAFLMDSLGEMEDPEQRKIAILEAGNSAGIYISPEMAADVAQKGLTAQTMLALSATATPTSGLKAWEWWVANPKDPDRDRKYIDMLVGLNPVRAGRTESDFKFDIAMKRNAILSKLYDPAVIEAHGSAWAAYNSTDVLNPDERAFLTGDKDFDPERLKDVKQQLFDFAEYNKAKEFAFEQGTKINVMARAEGREADVIQDLEAFSSGYAISALTAAEQALVGVKIDRTDAVLGFTMGTIAEYMGYPPDYQDTNGMLQARAGVEFREAVAAIKEGDPEINGADLINAVYDYIANKYRTVGVLAPEGGAEAIKRNPSMKVKTPKTGLVGGLEATAKAVGDAFGDVVEAPGRIIDMVTK